MAAALNSQVEGKDPHQAVGAAMVKGLLQESLLKSLPYLKILLRCGTDRPKIQDGTPSGPRSREGSVRRQDRPARAGTPSGQGPRRAERR
jgi:hypothetical protein